MGIFDKCLLVMDIDGTVLQHNIIPKKNMDALRYFKSEGGLYTVNTGRSTDATRRAYNLLECNAPAITNSGSIVYDFLHERHIFRRVYPKYAKNVVSGLNKKFPFVGLEVHCDSEVYIISENELVKEHIKYENLDSGYSNVRDIMNKDWTKVVFFEDRTNIMEDLSAQAKHAEKGKMKFIKTDPRYLELSYTDSNKATGIEVLKTHGYGDCKIFTAGNYYNDLEMLESSEESCCPADSPEDIKNVCTFVGGNCADGTVGEFIYYLRGKICAKMC